MQATEKVISADNSDKSLTEWPTLDDVCNNAKKSVTNGSPTKNDRNNQKCNKSSEMQNGYDSSKENEASRSTTSRGARKKGANKTKWLPVPIIPQPYKKRGNGKQFFDSSRSNNQKKNESSENSNGYDTKNSFRGGNRFRGKRGRGFSQSWRQRRESKDETENENKDKKFDAECYYNSAVYYDPYLHNAYAFDLRESALKNAIRSQIEYYFSEENLVKDIFMRRKMDSQGYVPLTLISTFHRVKNLTKDMNTIIEALTDSSKLELLDNAKVRPIIDPLKWPLPDTTIIGLRTDVPEFFPGQPYANPLIDGIYNLTLNGDIATQPFSHSPGESLSPDQVDYFDVDNPIVNEVYYPESISPDDHMSSNFYSDNSTVDQFVTNGCDYYSHTPSPVEHVNSFDFYSDQVTNSVYYSSPNVTIGEQVSNGVNFYYGSSPDEALSTGTDNSVEDQQEVLNSKSPEPAR